MAKNNVGGKQSHATDIRQAGTGDELACLFPGVGLPILVPTQCDLAWVVGVWKHAHKSQAPRGGY